MLLVKPKPVESARNLRERVDRLFRGSERVSRATVRRALNSQSFEKPRAQVDQPSQNLVAFLDFVADAMPEGDVYLFGGVLRDLALLGRRGFNSDIDLVVEGSWSHFVAYLRSLNAQRNKFGGYRLAIAGWPVDIWNAEDTWAVKNGLVEYRGIASLTGTTVLNWDAILMNWRTRAFIHRKNYFEDINSRTLDVVLEENPNPLGMAVRVFRHLSSKDARKITPRAARYLARCAKTYGFEAIHKAEMSSYENIIIEDVLVRFFEHVSASEEENIQHQFSIASGIIERELGLE